MNSMDFKNESSEDFLDYMEKKLPRQVVFYLQATGFDTASAFKSFDTSGTNSDSLQQVVELLRTQSAIMKANIPEAKTMYGMFYNSPESFIILPGHRSQILTFVSELKKSNKRQKLEERPLTSPSTRKNFRRRSTTPETPTSSRIRTRLQCSSDSTSALSASTIDIEEIEDVIPRSNMPQILKELKTTVAKYFSSNNEFKNLNISDGKEYDIFVNPALKSDTNFLISASITCNICASKFMLPINRSKFRPANFSRHIKSCILKKNKPNENKLMQSKMTSCIELPTGSNNQPIFDFEENSTSKTESELVNINDHLYKIPVPTNKSSVLEDTKILDIAAEIWVNNSKQSSSATNCQEQI